MSEAETPATGGQDAQQEGAPPAASPAPATPPAPTPPPAAWGAPPPPPTAGTEGFVFADVPNRIIAYVIDIIVLGIIGIVVGAVLDGIMGPAFSFNLDSDFWGDLFSGGEIDNIVEVNYLRTTVGAIAMLLVSAAYWIYMWTSRRGSLGMKALGMQIGNFPDGKSLTQDQAIRRWVALGGPLPLVQELNRIPALGGLISLAVFVYFIYLLYSTATSPTKQGFHDKIANSAVVKASRVV